MKKNHQIGTVKEIRNKKAVVQIGLMPITVNIGDITVVRDKP
jgi:DNA mismatch repair protein MutS2